MTGAALHGPRRLRRNVDKAWSVLSRFPGAFIKQVAHSNAELDDLVLDACA